MSFRLHAVAGRMSIVALRRHRCVALATLVLCSIGIGPLSAQQLTEFRTVTLVGKVMYPPGPIAEAMVELLRDSSFVRAARTRADGQFQFDELTAGDYQLRVRRIGFTAYAKTISLIAPRTEISIELKDARHTRDSLMNLEYARRLADARSRPRQWDCSATDEDVRVTARRIFDFFSGDTSKWARIRAREYGMPLSWSAFRAEFKLIASQRECNRLGSALDQSMNQWSDEIPFFRIGKVYVSYNGGLPIVASLSGKILAAFVVPN